MDDYIANAIRDAGRGHLLPGSAARVYVSPRHCQAEVNPDRSTMEKITKENLERRLANVNRRLEARGSIYRYELEGRNGYTALDRTWVDGTVVSTVLAGTKREVADGLLTMLIVLDDAARTQDGGLVTGRDEVAS